MEVRTITSPGTTIFAQRWNYYAVKNNGSTAVNVILPGGKSAFTVPSGQMGMVELDTDRITVAGSSINIDVVGQDDKNFPWGSNGGGADAVRFIGVTTTALTDGCTYNPIMIKGETYEAVSGDVAVYQLGEFIFDGEKWNAFGDLSGLGDLALKNRVDINTADDTVRGIGSVGSLPSVTYDPASEEIIFDAGTLPTMADEKTFVTSAQAVVS